MKQGICVSILFICFSIASAHASGRLTVELRPAQERIDKAAGLGDGRIDLVLRNHGDKVIEVSKDDIPITNSRGHLIINNLIVAEGDGMEVPYTGIVADYDESEIRTVRIPPKGSVVTSISIAKNYLVKAGQSYLVSLRKPVRYIDRPRELIANASKENLLALMKVAESASIRIVIDARTDLSALRSFRAAISPLQCTNTQLSLFNEAKVAAITLSQDGAAYVSSLYSYVFGPGNTVVGYFADSPRYIQWFGLHGSPFDPLSMNPVNDEINLGLMSVMVRVSDEQSIPKPIVSATCQCTAEDLPDYQIATAWVDPNTHYIVNTCEKFWQSPHMPTARDENSKVGTIIHEMVHFSDGFWSGSQSHYAVSYTDSGDLAITNREFSAKNPNTYKFFYLNQVW